MRCTLQLLLSIFHYKLVKFLNIINCLCFYHQANFNAYKIILSIIIYHSLPFPVLIFTHIHSVSNLVQTLSKVLLACSCVHLKKHLSLIALLSFALDHLSQPVDTFGNTRAVNCIRLLYVPRPIRDFTKVHLLGYLLLRCCIGKVRLVCEKEHWQLSVPYI